MKRYNFIDDESSLLEESKEQYKTVVIPDILNDISLYLMDNNVQLSKQFSDGRINASINEDELIKIIQKKFEIHKPKSRSWYDFSIEKENEFYPVNIKITDTTHADNLNCKLGIYYVLTGLIPDFPNEIRWLSYFEKLKVNIGKNKSKDYYFLVFNKQKPTDIFFNTLRGLNELQPNGNNLPFQCKWDSNKKPINRSYINVVKFVLTYFGESIKLRSEIYFNFKKYFPEYV